MGLEVDHRRVQRVLRVLAYRMIVRVVSADGTLVRANASYKSFLPIEVALDPEEYNRRLRRDEHATPR